MPDGTEPTTDTTAPQHDPPNQSGDSLEERVAFLEAEAKKAYAKRDKALAKLREVEGGDSGLTHEEREEYLALKKAQEEAELDRQKKAGEFDKTLERINSKHSEELKKEREAREAASQRLTDTLIGLEFAQAGEWFGDSGKTVLDPEVARAYFSRYVALNDDGRVVVKDPDGDVIQDAKTGKPAKFADAIGELIEMLPNKNRILRGSVKTGSGSSGGADAVSSAASRSELAQRAMRGDRDAIEHLKRTQPGGAMSRSFWDKAAAG